MRWSVLFLLAWAGLLGGCGGQDLDATFNAASKDALAAMHAQVNGADCPGTMKVSIGRRERQKFVYVTQAKLFNTAFRKGARPALLQLAPGRYFVISASCVIGQTVISFKARQDKKPILIGGDREYQSYFASFEVKAGEVVNIGAISFMHASGIVTGVEIKEIPEQNMGHFRNSYPKLTKALVKRHMKSDYGEQLLKNLQDILKKRG